MSASWLDSESWMTEITLSWGELYTSGSANWRTHSELPRDVKTWFGTQPPRQVRKDNNIAHSSAGLYRWLHPDAFGFNNNILCIYLFFIKFTSKLFINLISHCVNLKTTGHILLPFQLLLKHNNTTQHIVWKSTLDKNIFCLIRV